MTSQAALPVEKSSDRMDTSNPEGGAMQVDEGVKHQSPRGPADQVDGTEHDEAEGKPADAKDSKKENSSKASKVRTPTDYVVDESVPWLIKERAYKTRWNKDLNRSYVQPKERKSRWDDKPKTFKQGDPVNYFTS